MGNGDAGTEPEAWSRLAGRFGDTPLLRGRPVVRAGFDETVVKAPASKRVVLGLLLIGGGNGVPTLMWLSCPLLMWRGMMLVVGVPLALLFTLVGLSFVLCRGRLSWRPAGRQLRLRYGWLGFRKQAVIPTDALRVELSVGQGADSDINRGSACLYLRKQGRAGERLRLASGSRSDLDSAYEALKALLGGRGEDRTVAVVEPGGVLHVSKAPLAAPSANFRTARVTFPSADKAVVKATLRTRAFFLLFLVFGLGAFCLLAAVVCWRRLSGGGPSAARACGWPSP